MESNLIKQVLTKDGLINQPYSYYKWKGKQVCGTSFRIIREKYISAFFNVPTEYDSMMYKILKHHEKWMNVKNHIHQINTLSYYMGDIDETIWPSLIRDYYLNKAETPYTSETHDKDVAKIQMILEHIEPNLNWLHENNVLMQTL